LGIVLIVPVFLLFLLLFFFIPLEFRVTYHKKDQDDLLTVRVRFLWGLAGYRVGIPVLSYKLSGGWPTLLSKTKLEGRKGKTLARSGWSARMFRWTAGVRRLGREYLRLYRFGGVSRRFFKGIRCRHLYWVTEVGFTDPAVTGMAVGTLWACIYYVISRFYRNVTVVAPTQQVTVVPNFRQPVLRLDFDCIFSLRIGHIIIAGLAFLWALIRT